jgi:hypothetical protein
MCLAKAYAPAMTRDTLHRLSRPVNHNNNMVFGWSKPSQHRVDLRYAA